MPANNSQVIAPPDFWTKLSEASAFAVNASNAAESSAVHLASDDTIAEKMAALAADQANRAVVILIELLESQVQP